LLGRGCKKCSKQSHEFACPILAKADMRVEWSESLGPKWP
jgi:RNA polymerase subunit RPABC4/transcription elongation factor Spt4